MPKRFILWAVLLVAILSVLAACGPSELETKEPGVPEGYPPNYAYNPDYPIILSLSDNYGNVVKESQSNRYSGPDAKGRTAYTTDTVLRPGDTLILTVEAIDPLGRKMQYGWWCNTLRFGELISWDGNQRKWYDSNVLEYTISEEDFKTQDVEFNTGPFVVNVWVKTPQEGLPPRVGALYDDKTYLEYTITKE